MCPDWVDTTVEPNFSWHVSTYFPRRLGKNHWKTRQVHLSWMLLNPSNTPYQKSCRQTRERNSSIVNYNSGWKLTKFITLPQKMSTSRPPLWKVSIERWNPSCDIISLIMTRCPIWTCWTLRWMSTITPHITISVWRPMTLLPKIKRISGSDSCQPNIL